MTYGEYPEECQAYLDERMSDSDNAATAQKAATGQFCERAGRDRQTADGPRPLNRTLHIACCRCSLHVCCLVMHACANTQSVMFSCLVVCCLAARGPTPGSRLLSRLAVSVRLVRAFVKGEFLCWRMYTHTHTHTYAHTHSRSGSPSLSLSLSLSSAHGTPNTQVATLVTLRHPE
jgi:hypothetical protein